MSGGLAEHVYQKTIQMFGSSPEPAFENASRLQKDWGQAWGVDNDVGRIRSILVHRPGPELDMVDKAKRIEEIGSYGDLDKGWYWQSDTVPDMDKLRAQHDNMVDIFKREGIEVHYLDGQGQTDGMLKACYTRDSALMVKGGAVVCRMAPRIRQGEEMVVTRTLAKLGVPILRTIHSTGMLEGGSFAWINAQTAVVGRSIRINNEAIEQLDDVLKRQGVELLVVDLNGYTIHIDGSFVMVDKDLALVDATQLPYWFLEKLRELGVDTVEITPQDNTWIINGLAIAPGRYMMGNGASNRTLDLLQKKGVEVIPVDFDLVQLNGGGIHCSTMPLIRDAV
ncbi:MAG: arginine deiminase family protein [Anderseniella sp.]|nr:arginine deiminase family protein [Anderseniella sp.]